MYPTNYEKYFGDVRLEKRGKQLIERLFKNGSRSLQSISLSRSEQKAFYNLLRNDKVTEQKLIKELSARCARAAKGRVVLAIQDTSEVNLSAHKNRIDLASGVGIIDSPHEGEFGFKIHPSLVVDASNCFPLGFADMRIWNRPLEKKTKYERSYHKQPIEQKESNKWLEVSKKTKECLDEAEAVVIIQDREGDIFDQFQQLPDKKTFLLIRSRTDRRLEQGGKLWNRLSEAPLAGSYDLFIDADSHSKASARNALIEVRFDQIEIVAPRACKDRQSQVVYAIEAKEVQTTAQEPVYWRLLTTWPVQDYETARMIIEWYTWRWLIEEVFRMLKKEGFDIEGSELEKGWAIRKLCLMILDTIMKLLQMYIAYNMPEGEDADIEVCFKKEEQICLEAINRKAEGKTTALKNPYTPKGLKWAAWVIARTGGWKGYKSQRAPGMTTLMRGLQCFWQLYDGWNLNKDMGTR